ncbi:MAG: acetolactate synthase [Bacteroidaceae bacterium]|nr:acetolactate synthase [Bacteroidaceae bacterium]
MKTIKQLSVFLENSQGSLKKILSALSNQNIEIQAASVADTNDYGILRLITSDQIKTCRLLSDIGVLVNVNEVLAVSIEDSMAAFASTVAVLSDNGVEINYLYTFTKDAKLVLIIRPADLEKACAVAEANGLTLIQGWE